MHDWTLREIVFEWKAARVTLSFGKPGSERGTIVAERVARLEVPRQNEWGPSVSVNKVNGPLDHGPGLRCLEIEMQSGDVITIIAGSFSLPESAARVLMTTMAGK